MSFLRDVLDQIVRSALPSRRSRRDETTKPAAERDTERGEERGTGRPLAPGQSGPYATTEAAGITEIALTYNPDTDGDPDPGEIVWTWVPYEENDGRGKDRPVLIVAREAAGTLLGVQLSSRDHGDDAEWVPIGTGAWDGEQRPSWADTERTLRVHEQGMRREAAALDRAAFDRVVDALKIRHGWS